MYLLALWEARCIAVHGEDHTVAQDHEQREPVKQPPVHQQHCSLADGVAGVEDEQRASAETLHDILHARACISAHVCCCMESVN